MKNAVFCLLVHGLGSCFLATGQSVIVTVAGASSVFPTSITAALDAPLGYLAGVALDSHGNVYAADQSNNLVFLTSPQGNFRIVAGNGTVGFVGDGGPAVAASLQNPSGVAVDGFGNVFIMDTGNNRVRKVSSSGIITTVAGGNFGGFAGDCGPAIEALLNGPTGIAVDGSGNLFIADTNNQRVRKVSVSGIITTFAGGGNGSLSAGGVPATMATLFDPEGVAVDSLGDVLIAETGKPVHTGGLG